MTLVDVAAADRLREGEMTIVECEGQEMGVVLFEGRVFAVRNTCPHQLAPLCRGRVSAGLTATPDGAPRRDPAAPVVRCPWHGWEFDLRTGQSVWDAGYAVRTYPARIEGNRVLVDLSRPARRRRSAA